MKVDIEGAEPIALRNSSSLIQASSPPLVIIEVAEGALERQNFSISDILIHFSEEIYDLFISNISYPNLTPKIEVGYLYPLSDLASVKLPWLFNLIAILKAGKYSARKNRIPLVLFR